MVGGNQTFQYPKHKNEWKAQKYINHKKIDLKRRMIDLRQSKEMRELKN